MLPRLDWKFFVTLAITIAGVAAPIWLSQADLSSKALKLTVKSTAEMAPQGLVPMEGIQVSLDGHPLQTPSLSVLELSNSGSRPILASDFESPLTISTAIPSTLVKATLANNSPPSLAPNFELTAGSIRLQPLLLNPNDVVRFTLITANAPPAFSVRSRIAGVPDVQVTDARSLNNTPRYWLAKVVATLLIVLYTVTLTDFAFLAIRYRAFHPSHLATGITAGFGGVLVLTMQKTDSPNSTGSFLAPVAIAMVIALVILLMRRPTHMRPDYIHTSVRTPPPTPHATRPPPR